MQFVRSTEMIDGNYQPSENSTFLSNLGSETIASGKQQKTSDIEKELFKNKKIDYFMLKFDVDGVPIRSNRCDGYIALKPRGHDRITRHFVIDTKEKPVPHVKDFIRLIEEHYSQSMDYKVSQIHYKPLPR